MPNDLSTQQFENLYARSVEKTGGIHSEVKYEITNPKVPPQLLHLSAQFYVAVPNAIENSPAEGEWVVLANRVDPRIGYAVEGNCEGMKDKYPRELPEYPTRVLSATHDEGLAAE